MEATPHICRATFTGRSGKNIIPYHGYLGSNMLAAIRAYASWGYFDFGIGSVCSWFLPPKKAPSERREAPNEGA